MESVTMIKSAIPIFRTNPFSLSTRPLRPLKVSVKAPPPDFDYRREISEESRAAIAESHPELLDLADNGTLLLVQKKRFGPVPPWRTDFVEPESIWLIGTTHLSKDSAMHVERVVRALRPDNVVVELCRSRAGIMYVAVNDELGKQLRSNMFSLSGTGFFGAVGRSINLGGQIALALRLLLAAFSSKISSDMNRPFGDEFRAARKAFEEVGAQIVLGDRPIEITLQRVWKAMKWNEKLSLMLSIIRGIASSSNISINKLKLQEPSSDDSTFQLYEQLSFSYPSLLSPLIHERDTVGVQLAKIKEENALRIAFSLLISLLMILKDMLAFTEYMVAATLEKCFSKFHPMSEHRLQIIYIMKHNVVFKILFMVVMELSLYLFNRFIVQKLS